MNAKSGILGILDTVVKVAFVLLMIMLISKYSKLAYSYGYQIFNQKPVSTGAGREVTVTISEGDGAKTIGSKLAGAGLITDKKLFFLQERFSEYHGMEKPGTYELSTTMTPEEMIIIMSGGEDALDTQKTAEEKTVEEVEESAEGLAEEASETEEDTEGSGEEEASEGEDGD
ncbi:solute-binding protein [Butyrivibrio sp. X503]|uniref:endolytic transglycosylase MltG n=1 Tax=Butyrivibrio sp. X503 TaxID=2364878 RepID=UPI000EAA7620|nr:endolytic transglycosylase MltG [Butyrivibrio sp. X503]RKM58430.1 solute-binding protein [Butyrivibrio sp. X503]